MPATLPATLFGPVSNAGDSGLFNTFLDVTADSEAGVCLLSALLPQGEASRQQDSLAKYLHIINTPSIITATEGQRSDVTYNTAD
ncbi:uncharacterized protein MYCFIDRAFT_180171 [Pseudocercospora fijiensis CIRAD86]|uniref:Uncharacterized protein n=1 Tax=Pseudocercospora fijiensis (strain CIRAD86) TaxID=383855 RepID=M3AI45_PSEFD|nr:uncharacterized protein MYCFIDRAFT_180171 [Pseudocercospora fijiensis CIRAD86]EME77162.1 hypothetical protein MYCFIDRAFT_180171 [Pseudocercospora fijiensis CIRAD86]